MIGGLENFQGDDFRGEILICFQCFYLKCFGDGKTVLIFFVFLIFHCNAEVIAAACSGRSKEHVPTQKIFEIGTVPSLFHIFLGLLNVLKTKFES